MPRRSRGTWLKEGGRLKLAASAEFVESAAALPAFEQTYGFHLRSDQLLTLSGGNTAATLRAAAEGISGVNAGMAYGTDGELAALGLDRAVRRQGRADRLRAGAGGARAGAERNIREIAAALDPVFASLTLETLQTAERPHRGRWRGGRRRGARLSAVAAFPAVTPQSRRLRALLRCSFACCRCIAAAAAVGTGFVAVAPNRLLSGQPVGLFAAGDRRLSVAIAALGIALLATALAPPSRGAVSPCARCSPAALLLLVLAAAGQAAAVAGGSGAGAGPDIARRRVLGARRRPPRWRSSMRCSAPAPGPASASRSSRS